MSPSQTSTFLEQVIAAKISGLLSMIGSAFIIRDVVTRWRRKKSDQSLASIPRIILSMSIADLLNSFFVHFLGPWMVPKEKMGFDEYYYLPESLSVGGTDGTCATQAFLVNSTQITAVLTNATLAYAYWLSVCRGKNDRELKKRKWQIFLIIFPWTLGLTVASAAVVLGSSGFGGIWFCDSFVDENDNRTESEIESDSETDGSHAWRSVLIASILVVTNFMIVFFMLSLIKFVYAIEKRNDTYRRSVWQSINPRYFVAIARCNQIANCNQIAPCGRSRGGDRDRQRTIQVTKQGIWFILAYMATWIPPIIGSVGRDALPDAFMVFVACFAPLQGAFNAFVYFRPKLNRQESLLVPRLDIVAHLASSVRRRTQRLSITLPREHDIEQTEGSKSQITMRAKNNEDDEFGENCVENVVGSTFDQA